MREARKMRGAESRESGLLLIAERRLTSLQGFCKANARCRVFEQTVMTEFGDTLIWLRVDVANAAGGGPWFTRSSISHPLPQALPSIHQEVRVVKPQAAFTIFSHARGSARVHSRTSFLYLRVFFMEARGESLARDHMHIRLPSAAQQGEGIYAQRRRSQGSNNIDAFLLNPPRRVKTAIVKI